MNDRYKKSILLFGVVLPLFLIGVLLVIGLVKLNGFNAECKKREVDFEKYKIVELQFKVIKEKAKTNSEDLEFWEELMESETRGSLITHLNKIQSEFKTKNFKKVSHNWINVSKGIGLGANQPASQLKISFVGTYRAMQQAMLGFETRLPQLQLDSLVMEPVGEESNLIKFDTVFTLWTK